MHPEIIDLETPTSWPEPVADHLEHNHDLYLRWETRSGDVDVSAYDWAVHDLLDALRPYAIVGWHCTRLTAAEIARILGEGMRLPNTAMLEERIDACVADGQISPDANPPAAHP